MLNSILTKWASLILGLVLLPAVTQAQLDLDRDGLSDIWQQTFNLPNSTPEDDSDGDGADNLAECHAGTDPTDGTSVFVAESCHWNPHDETICFICSYRINE